MEVNILLQQNTHNATKSESQKYQEIIGSLLYLSRVTRPDISLAVNKLSRYSSNPSQEHFKYLSRVLNYLNYTKNYQLRLNGTKNTELSCYSDADWAGNFEDRTSTSGYCIFIGNNLISWTSKRQKCIALSTMEAEYIALGEAIKETLFINKLCTEMGIILKTPTLYCDNLATIEISRNPKNHQRAKHIDIKYHFIRKTIEDGEINLNFINSQSNKADIFTKPLNSNLFNNNRQNIGLVKNN